MTRTDHVDPTSTAHHLSKESSRIVTNRHCRILDSDRAGKLRPRPEDLVSLTSHPSTPASRASTDWLVFSGEAETQLVTDSEISFLGWTAPLGWLVRWSETNLSLTVSE